ncbi:MAG: septum formation initiator family protein [Treponema sp.]|nr:septum formation initiator family protein [Treponema sp.]
MLSFFVGRDGIWVYRQMQEQKRNISKRTASIQKINDELSLEYTALEKDKDVIAAYARKLDFVKTDEKLVKITGLRPSQTMLYDTGTVLKRNPVKYVSESACKAVGFAFFIVTLILMLLADYNRTGKISFHTTKKVKEDFIKGVPVYDVPQI